MKVLFVAPGTADKVVESSWVRPGTAIIAEVAEDDYGEYPVSYTPIVFAPSANDDERWKRDHGMADEV